MLESESTKVEEYKRIWRVVIETARDENFTPAIAAAVFLDLAVQTILTERPKTSIKRWVNMCRAAFINATTRKLRSTVH